MRTSKTDAQKLIRGQGTANEHKLPKMSPLYDVTMTRQCFSSAGLCTQPQLLRLLDQVRKVPELLLSISSSLLGK
jgi:hypothetical protein